MTAEKDKRRLARVAGTLAREDQFLPKPAGEMPIDQMLSAADSLQVELGLSTVDA